VQDPSSFSDRITDLPLTAQTVRDLINRKLGEAMRIGAAVRVVDSLLSPVACMPDGSNDIGPLIIPDTAIVTHDSTQPVHRSCRLTLFDPWYIPGMSTWPFPFNPISQFLHISQRLTCAGVSIEVPLGYFTMLWPRATISRGRRYFEWSGLDLTQLVNRCEMISDYTVTKGYTGGVRGAILDALEIAAVPKSVGGTGQTPQGNDLAGPAIPRALVDLPDAANQDITADLFFPAGTVMLDMINQLLDQTVNFYGMTPLSTPYVVENGQPVLSPIMGAYPKRKYSTGIPTADWDYSTTPETSIVEAPISQEVNSLLSAGTTNIVRVVGGSTSTALGALRVNTNADSVISTNNLRGLSGGPRALPHYEQNSKAASQAMTDLYADLLIEQGAQLTDRISANSLHNPLHGNRDLLIFKVTDMAGHVVINSDVDNVFEEESWSLPLKASGARMSHSLSRVAAI
jgi:hypothetical protein